MKPCVSKFNALITTSKPRALRAYFLDELQNVDGWKAYARRLVDSPRVQLCLTGSSSKLLSEEIATAMRGRSVPLEVFPLSFAEFLRFKSLLAKPLRKIHYYPLADSREVDFHVYDQTTGMCSLIQFAWEVSADKTFARELSALKDAREETGINDCTIVTWDTEEERDDGIRVVPLWKWCLGNMV